MPTLTLTNATLTNPADKTEVETSFSEVLALLNGALDNDNISANAGIATSKLEYRNYEFLVHFDVKPTTAIAPPTSASHPISAVAIPGDASDGINYTVISGSYLVEAAGTAGSTTFEIQLGYYSAGSWVQVGTDIVGTVTITGGTEYQSAALTIANGDCPLSNSQPRFLGLFLTALGTSALDEAHKGLHVTLKLRRTSGLRGT